MKVLTDYQDGQYSLIWFGSETGDPKPEDYQVPADLLDNPRVVEVPEDFVARYIAHNKASRPIDQELCRLDNLAYEQEDARRGATA